MSDWRLALQEDPELEDTSFWPMIDIGSYKVVYRKKIIRNLNIVTDRLSGVSGIDVAEKYNISESAVSRLLKRCFKKDREGSYHLSRALIPHAVLTAPVRRKKLSTKKKRRGNRCAFKKSLLNHPDLEKKFVDMISAWLKGESWAQNLTPKRMHNAMILYYESIGWSKKKYPYSTDSVAYESVRRFFHAETNRQIAQRDKCPAIVKEPSLPIYPFQEIQLDAHTTDLKTKVFLELEDNVLELRLDRLALYVVTDVSTQGVLAYYLALTRDPTQLDVLKLFQKIFDPWVPMDIQTPGVVYVPGSGFPSGIIDEIQLIGLNRVSLDNAFAHTSRAIINVATKCHGALLNFGPPGYAQRRSLIEHCFDLLNEQLSHRLANTTGSHPNDPKRETKKNAKKAPILTYQSFIEMIEVVLANKNAKVHTHLHGATPLEAMKRAISHQPIRMNFDLKHQRREAFIRYEEKKIYCSKKEQRRPYVSFNGLKYKSPTLKDRNLGGTTVNVKHDLRDIRKIEIVKLDGTSLGELEVQKSHRRRPLSFKTWDEIKKFERKYRRLGVDPVAGFLDWLLSQKQTPKITTQILRIYREAEENGAVVLPFKQPAHNDEETLFYDDDDENALTIASWTDRLKIMRNRA